MKCDIIRIIFVKLLDLSGYSARKTSKRPTCRKLAFWGKLSLKILAQLCAGHSIQVLLNLTLFRTLRSEANYFQCISQPESFIFNSFSWFHILFARLRELGCNNVVILDTPWISLPDHLQSLSCKLYFVVKGFYLKYDEMKTDTNVQKWDVQVLTVSSCWHCSVSLFFTCPTTLPSP